MFIYTFAKYTLHHQLQVVFLFRTMGDTLRRIPQEANVAMTGGKNKSHDHIVASRPNASLQHINSLRIGNGAASQVALFLLKMAALETVRRFSRAKCPWAWRGFQALQFLCYPPFKWFQRFAPFKALVNGMQVKFLKSLFFFFPLLSYFYHNLRTPKKVLWDLHYYFIFLVFAYLDGTF